MSKLQFKWKYGENKSQKYYEVRTDCYIIIRYRLI